tara:strand:- start:505 stop:981 length:477 start_codon:yes stop_codon:yes gene_type:complete
MKQIIKKSFLFLFLFITVNCGYKVINETEKNNFSIQEITTSGDKRVNFKIRNNLLNYTEKNNQNSLLVDIITKKNKSIKEKNIKNEITKYEISLNAIVKFRLNNSDIDYEINISNSGNYLVSDSYSTTLNNEKKLIDDLVVGLSEKILKKISLKLNDI